MTPVRAERRMLMAHRRNTSIAMERMRDNSNQPSDVLSLSKGGSGKKYKRCGLLSIEEHQRLIKGK